MNYDNLEILRERDVLKLVVVNGADLEQARLICRDFNPRSMVYILPVFGKIELASIVDFMKRRRMGNWWLQVQLHKLVARRKRRMNMINEIEAQDAIKNYWRQ